MGKEKCNNVHPMNPKWLCEKNAGHDGLHEVECWEIAEGNIKWGVPTRKEMGYGEGQ